MENARRMYRRLVGGNPSTEKQYGLPEVTGETQHVRLGSSFLLDQQIGAVQLLNRQPTGYRLSGVWTPGNQPSSKMRKCLGLSQLTC